MFDKGQVAENLKDRVIEELFIKGQVAKNL